MVVCRGGELNPKKLELVNPTRPKILTDLFERRNQELKTVIEGEVLPSESVRYFSIP